MTVRISFPILLERGQSDHSPTAQPDSTRRHAIPPRRPNGIKGYTRSELDSIFRAINIRTKARHPNPELEKQETLTRYRDTTDFDSVEVPPWEKTCTPLKTVLPVYPIDVERLRVEGTVWVTVLVETDSSVRDPKVEKSDSPLLNAAALAAIMQFRFSPAEMSGHKVAVRIALPFRFKLDE